jgi:hypothetical protein
MAWTYASLSTAIQAYVASDEDTLVTNMPVIVQQAEDRILKTVQLPAFRKNCTGQITKDDQYLGIPTDYLSPYSLSLDNSGLEFLLFKEVAFIREVYPSITSTGTPRYYAPFSDEYFIVGPTPDQSYQVEIHYFYKPESIVTATTSWLGTNAETALFYGCLLEAYTFQKGDMDMLAACQTRYDGDIVRLAALADPMSRTDEYRIG